MTIARTVEQLRNLAGGEAHDQTARCEAMKLLAGRGPDHTYEAIGIIADLIEELHQLFYWAMDHGPAWGTNDEADAVRRAAAITLARFDREDRNAP